MSSTDAPTPGTGPEPRKPAGAGRDVFRTALRDVAILLAGLAVLGVGIGALVAGVAGVWGALLGVALAAIFSLTTVWTMYRTAESSPTTMAAAVMGGWLAKMVVLVVALAVLRGMDFYDVPVFATVLLVGAVGSALVDYRAVTRARIPYVDPDAS
ncbi:hypothetical protein CLV28_2540 [Sediminihabitans luteus]|uniref:ATP synthase protein I n=1 Tax=Sediminihabitans luteus TaxID=1138585 RepID=A0A2M9CDX1_9CELL|nr:hypothetical protein [Sediminihabitans luteus]PJJ70062.1 hypothetical protein CLV28_2540 [Sediminihabitans luteus]GIJ00154.1 hypothetical protein Slu03_25310 [Sediminihabitans luteus]